MLRLCTLCLGLALAGAAGAAEPVFELAIAGGSVPASQRLIRVEKGAAITLRVTSDRPGSLHLHAYRIEVRVAPGAAVEVPLNARATGRFRFEWHADAPTPKSGEHHGPPLATLEVRPK